jgi:hypothetical protein
MKMAGGNPLAVFEIGEIGFQNGGIETRWDCQKNIYEFCIFHREPTFFKAQKGLCFFFWPFPYFPVSLRPFFPFALLL